jgi:CheY-like chemotaxis protein
MDTKAVLYVEDDESDVFFMRCAWQKARFPNPLFVVGDGQEATDYLLGDGEFADRARYPFPTLMLLDLKLPRMSGLELLEWLRRQEDGIRSLPVVILSSSALDTDIAAAKDLGVNDYWIKPSNPRRLAHMVASLNVLLTSNRLPVILV